MHMVTNKFHMMVLKTVQVVVCLWKKCSPFLLFLGWQSQQMGF